MAGVEQVNYMVILGSVNAVNTFTRNGQIQIGSELDVAVGPIGRAAAASINIGKLWKMILVCYKVLCK